MTKSNDVSISYYGQYESLLKLDLWTCFLTVITLGTYRFWARTRIRRYLWSSIAPGRSALEYNGTGLEKFLGFLIAIAVLAVYLGLAQVLLTYWGYSFFTKGETLREEVFRLIAIYAVGLAALPLIFYAQYRARRYMLSRTRWRGIQFGVDPAAWGYAWVALKNTLVTVLTLGILLPRQTYNLEKYRTDRTWYGNAQFQQGGHWSMLFSPARYYYLGLALILIAAGFTIWVFVTYPDFEAYMKQADTEGAYPLTLYTLVGIGITVAYIAYVILYHMYTVAAWRMLANNKTLGDGVSFTSAVSVKDVTLKAIWGWLGVILASILVFFLWIVIIAMGASSGSMVKIYGLVVLLYAVLFIFIPPLHTIWVTQPILRLHVTSLTIHNAQALDDIIQRAGDDIVDADGFADALDVGAAF